MTNTTIPARAASRRRPSNSDRRHRADFARQATVAAFDRHARALDWDDFADRLPGEMPRRASGIRIR